MTIKAGADVKAVQRMLGHASAAMTLDRYADLDDADRTSPTWTTSPTGWTRCGPQPTDGLRTLCGPTARWRARLSLRRR
ncbi:hypothetical protein ACI789_09435 [Geodermatophilus sp. SYSU D00965]